MGPYSEIWKGAPLHYDLLQQHFKNRKSLCILVSLLHRNKAQSEVTVQG